MLDLEARVTQLTPEQRRTLAARLDELGVPEHREPAETRLMAYVVPIAPGALSGIELTRELSALLPAHLVPSAILLLDELPRAPNGKVDPSALPATAPADEKYPLIEPALEASATERTLAALWAEALERPDVSRSDNFFDLGGHSLTATVLVSRIRKAFAIELPLRTLFDQPTIAALAPVVDAAIAQAASGARPAEPALEPVPRDRYLGRSR